VLFTSAENHDVFPKEDALLTKRCLDIPIATYKEYGEQMKGAIFAEGPDFLHYPLTTIFPLDLDIPCVLSMMDIQHIYHPEFFSKDELRLREKTYRCSALKARRIVAISQYTKKCLVKHYRVTSDNVDVIYPWCSHKYYDPCPQEECQAVRRLFHLPDDYAIYPAGTWPHKNHDRLLRAIAILKKRGVEIPLVLTGVRDKAEASVMAKVRKLALDELVYKLGYVERQWMRPLISAAKILVFPSLFEGFGIPILEAMAAGTPVACADNTSIPEVGGDAVAYFNESNTEAMAQAIGSLWVDRAFRNECVRRGRARSKEFVADKGISRLLAVYEKMASSVRYKGL
jgi:glycosyltransferase involved in cell wall biosynthesis